MEYRPASTHRRRRGNQPECAGRDPLYGGRRHVDSIAQRAGGSTHGHTGPRAGQRRAHNHSDAHRSPHGLSYLIRRLVADESADSDDDGYTDALSHLYRYTGPYENIPTGSHPNAAGARRPSHFPACAR